MFSGPTVSLMDKVFDRDGWYKNLKKHPLTPSNQMLIAIWVIVYILMGASYYNYK